MFANEGLGSCPLRRKSLASRTGGRLGAPPRAWGGAAQEVLGGACLQGGHARAGNSPLSVRTGLLQGAGPGLERKTTGEGA